MDKKSVKPSWDAYFLDIAKAVSVRASCPRGYVGAVIVSQEKRILSTGYNGAPAGEMECKEDGCIIENDHCLRAVHAEINAICHAAKYGVAINGASIFIYDSRFRHTLCGNCIKAVKRAGIISAILQGKSGKLIYLPFKIFDVPTPINSI